MKRIAKIAVAVLIPAGLVGGYFATSFYLFPAWLQRELPAFIAKETGLRSSLNAVNFNPLTLQLQLKKFELEKILRFEELDIQLNWRESLTTKSLIIEKITLNKPFFELEKQQNGALNIDALLPKSDAPKTEKSGDLFPLTMKNFTLSDGQISFQNGAQTEKITPLNFTLTNFSTQNAPPAKFDLTANWQQGGDLHLSGDFQFLTLKSNGKITFQSVNLAHLLSLMPENKFKVAGKGELSANYRMALNEKPPLIQIENGVIALNDLSYKNKAAQQITLKKIACENLNYDHTRQNLTMKSLAFNTLRFTEKQTQLDLPTITLNELSFNLPTQQLQTAAILLRDTELFDTTQNTLLFKLPELELKKLTLNLQKKTVAIGAIQAKNADFRAWLNPNGELNYQTLLPEDEEDSKAENAQSEAFWGVKIDSVALTDFGAVLEDKTLPKPLSISIKPLSLKLTELSNAIGAKLPFELNTGINNSGSLHLKGNAEISPFAAQSDIAVNALNLEKFQSYVDKFAHFDLIKGVFSLDGKLDVAQGDQGELDVKFKGNSGIARLVIRDQIQNKDLVKWDNLTLKNIDADVLAQRYSATSVLLDKPYARVVIAKDKTLNFADIWIQAHPPRPPSKGGDAIAGQNPMYFKLDNVQISNGSSSFADLSMILPFSAEIKGLEGGASGISSNHESTINVTLKGNAYDLAPVDIKGKIQPYIGDYRAALSFKGMPMPLVSAYMAEFSGYKVEKGKMSLGMNYDVTKGELTATNNLLIEQFELGEQIDNPHAVNAPFDLAIALLKDVNGIINLDVPITGSLNNPQFSLSGIIGDALLNVMTKVITSPFHALANLLGTDDDLSVVQFAAGQSELSDWQQQKLAGLAKVLRDRDVLKLEIKGTAFQLQDWAILREEALIDRLKTLKSEALNRENKQKIRPEYVELDDADAQKLLAQEFQAKFPQLVKKSFWGGFELVKPDDADAQKLLAQEFQAKFPQLVKKSFWGGFELVKPEMGEFYSVAKQKLSEALPVEQKRLIKLAAARARAIAKYVVQQGGVPNERVFILDTAIDPPRENDEINALLSLKVD